MKNQGFWLFLSIIFSLSSQQIFASELFRKNTRCPFSTKVSAWQNEYSWDLTVSVDNNVEKLRLDLDRYVDHLRDSDGCEPIHFFAVEAPASIYAPDLKTFAQWVRAILYGFNSEAIEALSDLKPKFGSIYENDGWKFSYRNIRFFIITSAPLYPNTSSRFSGGEDQKFAMIHLQPESLFEWHLSRLSVPKQEKKEAIRRSFARVGRDYFSYPIMGGTVPFKTHEAPRYVKPLSPDDPVVTWWVRDESIDLDAHLEFSFSPYCLII